MTNTQLAELLVGQPADVQAEIIRINTEARPIALQIALLVPFMASLVGMVRSFRMIFHANQYTSMLGCCAARMIDSR